MTTLYKLLTITWLLIMPTDIRKIKKLIELLEASGMAEIEIKEQYRNMKQQFEGKMHIVDIAEQAMKDANIEPKIKAIRGGTDGAQLSYMGLPCPNIFAGGINFHGPYEYVALESMEKAVKVIINIARAVKKK